MDRRTERLLEEVLGGQEGRIERFEGIGRAGYDAKDVLLRHCREVEGREDVLARR